MLEAREHNLKARHWLQNSLVAFVSTIVIGTTVWLLMANDFSIIRNFFNVPLMIEAAPYLLKGFWLNVQLFMIAEVTILIWSLIVAILRGLPGRAARPIRWLMVCYVDLFRGMPELLTILIVVFGLRQTGIPFLSQFDNFWSVVLAMTLVSGAYLGEVIRGAMEGVHPSQVAAARSLGMSYGQTLRRVVIPQGLQTIVVPLLNGFIGLQKATALVSFVGMMDSLNYAQSFAIQHANLSTLTGVALMFVVITIPLTRVADSLMLRDKLRVVGGGR